MIAERIDFEGSYKQLERAVTAVIDGGDRDEARTWLSGLGGHLDQVIADGDLDTVATWSSRLDRLADNLPGGEFAELVVGYLTAVLDRLDRSAAALAQQRDVQERERVAGGVRPRVLALVRERSRIRSGDIAAALEISPSQASRALRELLTDGSVFLAEPDPRDRDKRVHRYVAAETAHHAHAA